jgi:hypothetical protein
MHPAAWYSMHASGIHTIRLLRGASQRVCVPRRSVGAGGMAWRAECGRAITRPPPASASTRCLFSAGFVAPGLPRQLLLQVS